MTLRIYLVFTPNIHKFSPPKAENPSICQLYSPLCRGQTASDASSIFFTSPDSIFAINSEYFIFVFVLSITDDNNTTNIIPNISHMANVFNFAFNFLSSLRVIIQIII